MKKGVLVQQGGETGGPSPGTGERAILSRRLVLLLKDHPHRIFSRISRWLFRCNRFVVFVADLPTGLVAAALPAGRTIREVSIEELRLIRGKRRDLPSEFYQDLGRPEARAFLAFDGAAPALIAWVMRGGSSGLAPVAPDEGEVDQGHCLQSHRGRGLYAVVLASILEQLGGEGCRRVWMVVHDGNPPALKAAARAGFARIGTVRRWLWFSWKGED